MTPCYYCEEDRKVACRACIHGEDGPEIEQVIAWRAAPPPAADAVSIPRAALDEVLSLLSGLAHSQSRTTAARASKAVTIIAAALAARSKK